MHARIGFAGLLFLLSATRSPSAYTVAIQKGASGFQLLRDGQPFVIKGVDGGAPLDKLSGLGGNAVRTYGPDKSVLDKAQSLGLGVLLGISGTDSTEAKSAVMAYKDHPALLMWALGNELEMQTSDQAALWKNMNAIAAMIKKIDTKHPIITAIAELGNGKLADIASACSALDAVGINSYGSAATLATRVPAAGWTKPFFVTEFGPRGHWEVTKTPWGLPIEQSSSDKADLYLTSYLGFSKSSQYLGSFAFLWGDKQEKTHTWYGMFLQDGSRLGAVDAMQYAWSGAWPANRCPRIGAEGIKPGAPGPGNLGQAGNAAIGDGKQRYFQPGARIQCDLAVSDTDNTEVTVTWDLRVDVSDNAGTGGATEPPTSPLPGAVISMAGKSAIIEMPADEKNYRIFAYAKDAQGSAATANLPIVVSKTAPPLGIRAARPFEGGNLGPSIQSTMQGRGNTQVISLGLAESESISLTWVSPNGRSAPILANTRLSSGIHSFAIPKIGMSGKAFLLLNDGKSERKFPFLLNP